MSQVCAGHLWYINTTNSELISYAAAAPPEYSPDLKTVKIYLRKGVTWSDGTPFTADDVLFTIDICMKNPKFGCYYTLTPWVDKYYKLDNYTVVIELKQPNPRFHYYWTVIIYGASIPHLLPKHIWEKVEDPVAYKFYPPVCLGPYVLKDVDPGGTWFLWERNENWWGTKLYGIKPGPKYVLFIHQGPEEKKALAMSRHELDAIRTFLPENFEIVWKANPYIGGWRSQPPFAWPFDACVKGIGFNVLRYPYNITEVRRALTFAIDFYAIYNAFVGPDGSAPIPNVLPLVRYIYADKPYYVALKDELLKLGLDPSPRSDVQEHLKSMGLDPTIVWWKYDPAEAERLLKSVGFYKGPDGKWYMPDGKLWVVRILTTSGFEMESQRIAYLVADQWRKFGLTVEVEPVEAGPWSARTITGDWDVATIWPGCSLLLDAAPHIWGWHSRYCNPDALGNGWSCYGVLAGTKFPERKELDKIIEQLELTPPWELDKIFELTRKALLIWAEQMPWIGFFPTPFYTLNDRYCWENWPYYPENHYMDTVYWWAQMQFIILNLKPSGRCPVKDAITPTVPAKFPIETPTPTPTSTPSPTPSPTISPSPTPTPSPSPTTSPTAPTQAVTVTVTVPSTVV
ncbi:MAG: ABC transporter substrate-binding protein, partial [Ignisphaera sp.]